MERRLALATRRQRENIFKQVIAAAGNKPFVQITTPAIITGVERRKDTPAQARHFLDTLRGLFRWAVRPRSPRPTQPLESRTHRRKKARAFRHGARMTLRPSSGAGPLALGSGCGSTFCSTPACGAAMRLSSDASMCAMALRRSH